VILLLGNTGYVGHAFVRHFDSLGLDYTAAHRDAGDLSRPDDLARLVNRTSPDVIINAAGWPGSPNVDATETHRGACVASNLGVPLALQEVVRERNITLGHVSTGCIYFGIREDGSGFTEKDPPNFGFTAPTAGLYSRCKSLAEQVLVQNPRTYIWRLRMPFDHRDGKRNYLGKLLRYPRLLEATNSISHLGDFVASCWETISRELPGGIYNLTNPGSVTTREIVAIMEAGGLGEGRDWQFFESETDFLQKAAKVRRASCVLNADKAVAAGLPMRPVREAIEDAVRRWEPME